MPPKKAKKEPALELNLDDEQELPTGDTAVALSDDDEDADVELSNVNEVVNPNVADQLENVAEGEGDERSDEEKLQAYLDADESAAAYSKDVQKRIKKLTYDRHEAVRREQAAVEYAQGVQKENAKLQNKQQHQDGVFINEHKGRIEAQLNTAKQQYKEAYQSEDADLIAEANQNVARASAELTQAEQTEVRFKRHIESKPAPDLNPPPYQPPPAAGTNSNVPTPDPKAEAWAERNAWFGSNTEMTEGAMAIHDTMTSSEGYLATSDAYYTELDSRMHKNFPQGFVKPKISGEQSVAGGRGAPATARHKGAKIVNLTPSQVNIARKLGLTLEQYAKYV